MEDYFLPEWLTVLMAGGAGAWMFAIVRPYANGWKIAAGSIFAATAAAFFVSFAICEYIGCTNVRQLWVVAFSIGLLSIILCRAAVSLAETQALNIVTAAFKRLIGIRDDEPPRGTGDGGHPH